MTVRVPGRYGLLPLLEPWTGFSFLVRGRLAHRTGGATPYADLWGFGLTGCSENALVLPSMGSRPVPSDP